MVLLSLEQQYHGGQISRHLGPQVNNSLCKPSAVGSVYKCGSGHLLGSSHRFVVPGCQCLQTGGAAVIVQPPALDVADQSIDGAPLRSV